MRHSKGKKIALHIIMYTFVLIMMIPLLWLVVISFKTNREILTEPLQLPDVWSFQNYIDALQQLDIVKLFSNTIIISVIAVIIQLVITISSSFAIFSYRTIHKPLCFAIPHLSYQLCIRGRRKMGTYIAIYNNGHLLQYINFFGIYERHTS